MKIHPIINITYLKPLSNPTQNPFNQPFGQDILENPKLMPNYILRKQKQQKKKSGVMIKYLIKYKGRIAE